MGKIIINGRICEYTDETNVLEVIRNHGFNVPTLRSLQNVPCRG